MDETRSQGKSLFERTYKTIKFIKSSQDKEKSNEEDGESIAEFYRNLSSSSSQSTSKQESQTRPPEPTRPVKTIKLSDVKNALFKAVEANDVAYVREYLSRGHDPFVEDEYQWNVFMIAVASSSNDVLACLLSQEDNERPLIVERLTERRDLAGNTAVTLARNLRNPTAMRLIDDFLNPRPINNDIKPEPSELAATFWCDICKASFAQTQAEHVASIVHQINDTDSRTEGVCGKQHLTSDNKGYQLMVKSGWDETSGLGPSGQGLFI